MELKSIGVASLAKVLGVLYAAMGLIFGAIFSFISILGASFGSAGGLEVLFGIGAIIIMPIFYGLMGAIGGAISAALYNVMARSIGGVELELEPRHPQP